MYSNNDIDIKLDDYQGENESQSVVAWEPGASDNLFLHFGGINCPEDALNKLIDNVTKVAIRDDSCSKDRIVELINHWKVIHLVDPLIKHLVKNSKHIPMRPNLYNYARALAFYSNCTESIKLGIALMGVVGCNVEDITSIKEIAMDEEYTLYVVLTLDALLENPEEHIWRIAQSTFGWGRINAIEYLKNTKNIEIQRWLIREGYKNTVMAEYTAHICATAGNLKNVLSIDIIDSQTMDATTDILNALLAEGPSLNINYYSDAAAVCIAYAKHVRRHGRVREFALLLRIKSYIKSLDLNNLKNGWNVDNITNLQSLIKMILHMREWNEELVLLIYNNNYADEDVLLVANYFKLDMWGSNWKKLKSNPLNPQYWSKVLAFLNEERMVIVCEYMRTALPWNDIINDSESYSKYAIEEIITAACKFPEYSEEFLILLLGSKDAHYRNSAIQILSCWERGQRSQETTRALNTAYLQESNEDTKERFKVLLELR